MLEIKNLSAFYGKTQVLQNINLRFEKGKFYAVLGRNSSGKSTLMSCIMSLKKYGGQITLDGKDVSLLSHRDRACKMSFLPQHVSPSAFSVSETVCFGRNFAEESKAETVKRAEKAMHMAEIFHISQKAVCEISGGERQLCYFAMNLCQDAEILILDEPTSNLDMEHEARILSCAKELCKCGKTVICVIHNLAQAVKYADEIVLLDKGKCVFSGCLNECLDNEVIEKTFCVRRFETQNEIFFAV